MATLVITLNGFLDQADFTDVEPFISRWNQINDHLIKSSQNNIEFIAPVTVFSIITLDALVNAVFGMRQCYPQDPYRIRITFTNKTIPEWQHAGLLGPDWADKLEPIWAFMLKKRVTEESLVGFSVQEMNNLQECIDAIRGFTLDSDTELDYKKKFYTHVRPREAEFKNLFPELLDFYYNCQLASNHQAA